METVQEVDEPKESPPIQPDGSPGNLPLNSISSSSTSPSSVKLNQSYIEKQQKDQNNIEKSNTIPSTHHHPPITNDNTDIVLDISSNQTTEDTCNNSFVDIQQIKNNSICSNSSKIDVDDVEIDVTTPLLNGKNSTNTTSNDYSISEKDALLESSN